MYPRINLTLASTLTAIAMCSSVSSAVAQQVAPLEVQAASSAQSIAVKGRTLPFTVTWEPLMLKDPQGAGQVTVSATSFVRSDVADASHRPVIFAFNGGPGAASSMLGFGLLGPHLRGGSTWGADVKGVETNESTLLDAADIVMFDPAGTGLSRAVAPEGNIPYLKVDGDAKSAEQFLRAWLRVHGRENAPILIVSESYGTYRASYMSADIADLNVVGLVLISPAIDLTSMDGGDQSVIFDFPSMAVAAFAHGKVKAKSDRVAYEVARQFAQSDLAIALQQGWSLSPALRHVLASRMSTMIGLPAATIEKADLRVKSQDFLEQLLPGQVVGRIDTRIAAEAPRAELVPGRRKEADDPSLAMGASNVKKSPWVTDYLRAVVGVKTTDDYVSIDLNLNFGWDWRSASKAFEDNTHLRATPRLEEFMVKRPAARILVTSAYYDLATPMLAMQYTLAHSSIPKDRVEFVNYHSGHAIYDSPTNRAEVAREIRRFLNESLSAVR